MKKLLEYIKLYSGWIALGLLVVVLFLIFGKDIFKQDIVKKTQDYVDKKRKSIDAINDLKDQSMKKRDEVHRRHVDIYTKIDKEFAKKRKQLSTEEEEELKFLINKTKKEPGMIARRMARKYGWEYVE